MRHRFGIAGKTTPPVKSDSHALLTVVFGTIGTYAYRCSGLGRGAPRFGGALAVGAPPPSATTAPTHAPVYPGPGGTVIVTMFEYGFTLSPSTIPAGDVTFVMKNAGTVSHDFDIETVKIGPYVDPGQTATETVDLEAGRTYTYVCDTPDDFAEGMEGTFIPVG